MRIVHNHLSDSAQEPKAKRISKREARASAWMARFYQRNYDRAIKENMEEIKEIQKYVPGWMPEREDK